MNHPDASSGSHGEESDEEQQHDQLPSVEEYKASVDAGSRKIDPERIMEQGQPDDPEDDQDFVQDGDDDDHYDDDDEDDGGRYYSDDDGDDEDDGGRYYSDDDDGDDDGGDDRYSDDDDDDDDEEQVIHDQLPSVDEIHALRAGEHRKVTGVTLGRKLVYALMTVAFLCIVIIPPAVLSKKAEQLERRDEVVEALLQLGVAGTLLEDPESPQAKAAEFLATETYDNSKLSDEKFMERYALTVWYYATSGPSWRYQMRFLSPQDACFWYSWFRNQRTGLVTAEGVICSTPIGGREQVIELLDMPSNLLRGTIPSELQLLSNSLEQLHVEFNPGLQGEIPTAMSELTKLWSMELQYCGFTGTLPDWLGTSLPLRRLGLSNNLLTGSIPRSLLQQTQLQILALDDNGLTGDIEDFGPLINLQYLYMEDNLIQGELTNPLIANWTIMKEMDFSRNDLAGKLPSDLFTQMTNLEIVDLHGNEITGALPTTFADDSPMMFLALQDNKLGGEIPTEISSMPGLKHLDLSRNVLRGTIPSELGKLSLLKYLFLGSNIYDVQTIPDEFSELTELREFSIKNANLKGKLPGWISYFTNLQLLDLDQNGLQGTIPAEYGESLKSLDHLMLNRNALTGTIPDSFKKLEDLQLLLLDHNSLTGSADVVCTVPDLRLYVTDCDAIPSSIPGQFEPAEIACTCCTTCCNSQNATCNMYDWNVNLDPIWEYGYTRYTYTFSQVLVEANSKGV